MANELTVSKEQTARFVHDAMEMETAVFTLTRAIRGCNKKKNQLLENAQTKVDKAKAQVDIAENNYKIKEEERHKLTQERIPFIDVMNYETSLVLACIQGIAALLCFFGIIGIIMYIIGFCVEGYMPEDAVLEFILSIAFVIVPISIILITGRISSNLSQKKHYSLLKSQTYSIQEATKHLQEQQSAHNLALADFAHAQLAAEALDAQITTLKKRRAQIGNILTQFYALDVIKPKYRNIECAVIMDELYQNDRVDTMREAMDKCETRLFQNEVLQMGQNIQAMLGKMTIALAEISDKLDSIKSNVKIMSQDLYTFADRIAQGQQEQLRETELSRYAAERVAASATYLEWHQRNQNY